jgi:hypothetical protein
MIIDTNAYLGPFAFRQLRHNTPDQLLKLMDAKGIDRAMVSNPMAITYKNTQPANEELAAAVRGHADRLIPQAVINPFYAGWEDDLQICREEFGIRGVRLYPKWHNYALADECCAKLISAAVARKMVVSIPVRVADSRQRSWLVDVPDVPLAEIVELLRAYPEGRFMILNGSGFTGSPLGKKDEQLPAGYGMEISRLSATLANELGQLVSLWEGERVVFGSGMPFKYPDVALLKLEVLDAPQEVLEKVRWKNAAALLAP